MTPTSQQVDSLDEWGEPVGEDGVKAYKIADIRDITVAVKQPQPPAEASPAKQVSKL